MELIVKILVALIAVPVGIVIGVCAAKWSIDPRKSGKRRAF